MSDRIAVMNAGRIEQVGTPAEIYDHPASRYVAEFIGEINLIEGTWAEACFVADDGAELPAPARLERHGGRGIVAVRPEKVSLTDPGEGVLRGRLDSVNFLGGQTLLRIVLGNGREMLVKVASGGRAAPVTPGAEVGLAWRADDVIILAR